MSGSQPATVGELHPLHRNALRHPLILDGLSLRLRTLPDSAFRLRRAKRVGERNCACTFYLVFKEPALPDTDDALEARSRMRTPSGVSPLGEPYNLTSAFWFVSTPRPQFFCRFRASPYRSRGTRRAEERLKGCASQKDCWRIRPPAGSRLVKYTRRFRRCQPWRSGSSTANSDRPRYRRAASSG